jgi:hypothetical protein
MASKACKMHQCNAKNTTLHSKKGSIQKARGAGSLASLGLLLQRIDIDIKEGKPKA